MKYAEKLNTYFEAAKKGGFALTKLNWIMWWVIPFNKRHNFKIAQVGEDFIRTEAPYQRKNFNHIRGIHACGIATISEFATGLLLLTKVDPAKYRIIMSELKMTYHFQAKMKIFAESRLTQEELQRDIIIPLQTSEKVNKTMIAEVKDEKGNHIATAHITWQLKNWKDVKTKIA